MIATIWNLIAGDLLPYIATGLAALVGAVGLYFKGRSDAKAKDAAEDAEAYRETIEKVTDETLSDDPAADLRRRMRERAKR